MSIAVVNGKMLDESQKVHVRNLLIQGSKLLVLGMFLMKMRII